MNSGIKAFFATVLVSFLVTGALTSTAARLTGSYRGTGPFGFALPFDNSPADDPADCPTDVPFDDVP